jgi:hypothetical protein
MKRSRIIVFLRLVVAVVVLATPAAALPEAASAGWTWDENAITTNDGSSDVTGWTWDEASTPPDEAATTDDGSSDVTGWTWDEASTPPEGATAVEPAP